MSEDQFTPVARAMPPKGAAIEWVTPTGQIERGKWLGGAVWIPEGRSMYLFNRHPPPAIHDKTEG